MRTLIRQLLLIVTLGPLFTGDARSATLVGIGDPVVTERGPHHAVVTRVREYLTSYARKIYTTNSYVELASGMHYRDEQGNWVPSRALIELPRPDLAVAREGLMQVIFSANARTAGAVDVTVDSKRFRSHVLGVAYAESDTGRAVLVAEVQDSIGDLVGHNEVWYRDALVGEMRADIQYIYTISGLEQNIVIRESVHPSVYGFDAAKTRIQVITEWLEAPQPVKSVRVLKREKNPVLRARMLEPDLVEEDLSFGSVIMPRGAAFPLGDEADSVPTGKTWEVRENRQLLIEQIDYEDVRLHLEGLPQARLNQPRDELMAKVKIPAGPGRPVSAHLPQRPPLEARVKGNIKPQEMAELQGRGKGFVLDYHLINANTNDFTFRGDTTYLVTASVTLTGSNIMEAGCVIKYTNYPASGSSKLLIKGPLTCLGTEFRPVYLTALNDNSVGETIPTSTGNPTNFYGRTHLYLDNTNAPFNLKHLHSRYAKEAIFLQETGMELTLAHSQIGNSDRAFANYGSTITLRNVLVHDTTSFVFGYAEGTIKAEHLTVHKGKHLLEGASSLGTNTLYLTNSLVFTVTNGVRYIGSNNATNLSDSGVFISVGFGQRYLVSNSPYRNVGTTVIDATLASDLKQRTTYPPLLWTNNVYTIDVTLNPQAQRDIDTPDLGYHYLPADWLMKGIDVNSATFRIQNGAVIAIDASATNYGIRASATGHLISEGTPLYLNRFVRTHAFQETGGGAANLDVPLFADVYPSTSLSSIRLRFTDIPQIQKLYAFNQENNRGTLTTLTIHDSLLRGGTNYLSPSLSNQVMVLTNNLFEDNSWRIYPYVPCTLGIRNGTFKRGHLALQPVTANAGSWTLTDNIFDYTTFSQNPFATITNNYNGYLTNASRLTPNGAADIVLATNTVNFQTGALGSFYLPSGSGFINVGSVTNAGLVGLWHYTTLTSQAKETNSVLDLGFHYIALNGSNQPIDTDSDGTPDYVEDANGNGSVNSGETDWNSASDIGLLVRITRPSTSSTVP